MSTGQSGKTVLLCDDLCPCLGLDPMPQAIIQLIQSKCSHQSSPFTDGLLNGLLCKKAVFPSTTFVFSMDAQSDRFLSATNPVSRNHCTKNVIVNSFGDVSPGYFC
ncbi:hypothetical protein TNCV_1843171 [Trichonephila clavipes]|nr:hypothetical protein TNCV_1843171 [Trichonephila clavipes]